MQAAEKTFKCITVVTHAYDSRAVNCATHCCCQGKTGESFSLHYWTFIYYIYKKLTAIQKHI